MIDSHYTIKSIVKGILAESDLNVNPVVNFGKAQCALVQTSIAKIYYGVNYRPIPLSD